MKEPIEPTARTFERIMWFAERYTPIASGVLSPRSKVFIGDDQVKTCRYCNLSDPEVTFNLIAHAFPEMVGNKSLVDYNECDACNTHFSKKLEDDFGKWSQPWRSIHMIPGKNGVPVTKARDGSLRAEKKGHANLQVKAFVDSDNCVVDEVNGKITLKITRDTFIPMGVFKCLVKMAIAIAPVELLSELSHLSKWILEGTHSHESFPYSPLRLILTKIPGPLPKDTVRYQLFKRSEHREDCPYLMFVLLFGNNQLQIILPMPAQDRKIIGKSISVLPYPHHHGTTKHASLYGNDIVRHEDLSSFEPLKGSIETIVMKGDLQKVNKDERPDLYETP